MNTTVLVPPSSTITFPCIFRTCRVEDNLSTARAVLRWYSWNGYEYINSKLREDKADDIMPIIMNLNETIKTSRRVDERVTYLGTNWCTGEL